MNTLSLTKKLVSLPSYVGSGCDESKVGQFIFEYLQNFPWLIVQKQFITKRRFNVIARDKYPTSLLFCGHIDTVEPKNSNQLKPKIKNGRLYGLGSSDMKGTIACMLKAVEEIKETKGLMWLFYIDEEYDFLGMQKFIDEYQNKIKPKLIIGEGSSGQIRNGCRGLIEIKFTIFGKTGHASKPENGNNAITGALRIYDQIARLVSRSNDPFIGKSDINLASINGGLDLGQGQIGRQGNNIADFCEFIVDIRTTSEKLRAKNIIAEAEKAAKRNGLTMSALTRHDRLGWFSPIEKLPELIVKGYPIWKDFRTGYVDTQMLNEAFKCPCLGFGVGQSDQAHKKNEYIPIKNLVNGKKFYLDLIKNSRGGEI